MSLDPPASTGVRLARPSALTRWTDLVETPHAPETTPALDWFVMLEALSDHGVPLAKRKTVPIVQLARAMGSNPNYVNEGHVFRTYDRVRTLVEATPEHEVHVSAGLRLYRQARLATFSFYRDGFVGFLETIPFTAEAALHGYVRVLLEWARQWPGLALATPAERKAVYSAAAPEERQGRHRARLNRTARVALPNIALHDVMDLTRLIQLEAADIGADQESTTGREFAAQVLLTQASFAASHVMEDESLTALSAGNIARNALNDVVGGALLRLRIRPRDSALVEARILAEVRRYMIDPYQQTANSAGRAWILAQLEQQFTALSAVQKVFESEVQDD